MKKKPANSVPTSDPEKIYWVILGLTLAIVLYARFSLLGMPLERDEGGFAYIGQHLFGDQLLYSDLLDNKLPGLYFLYWIFNQLPGGYEKSIHLCLLLMHAGTLGLFFMWTRKAFNFPVASMATSLFAVSAIMPGVLGFAAHATQLIMLPVMGALLLIWNFNQHPDNKRLLNLVWAGLLLGFSFTVKQPAIVFIVFAISALMLSKGSLVQNTGRAFVLGFSSLLPFGAIAGYFYLQGRFDDFWLWTYTMPTVQTAGTGDYMFYLEKTIPRVVGNHWLFWGLGLSSLLVVPFSNFSKSARFWAIGLLLFSILSAAIGLAFMPHYFVPMVPWLALGIAVSLFWVANKFAPGNTLAEAVPCILLILMPIFMNSDYFLNPNFPKIVEQCYPWNGFSEAKAVAKELKKRLKPGERIAVLGSEPEINYYTNTELCSPHLYMYPVVREHKLKSQFQKDYLQDLFGCNAAYVVLTASESSWTSGFAETPFFKRDIFPKITERYDLIGRANIGQVPLNIVWDEALKTHEPPKCPPMFVFKRKQ